MDDPFSTLTPHMQQRLEKWKKHVIPNISSEKAFKRGFSALEPGDDAKYQEGKEAAMWAREMDFRGKGGRNG